MIKTAFISAALTLVLFAIPLASCNATEEERSDASQTRSEDAAETSGEDARSNEQKALDMITEGLKDTGDLLEKSYEYHGADNYSVPDPELVAIYIENVDLMMAALDKYKPDIEPPANYKERVSALKEHYAIGQELLAKKQILTREEWDSYVTETKKAFYLVNFVIDLLKTEIYGTPEIDYSTPDVTNGTIKVTLFDKTQNGFETMMSKTGNSTYIAQHEINSGANFVYGSMAVGQYYTDFDIDTQKPNDYSKTKGALIIYIEAAVYNDSTFGTPEERGVQDGDIYTTEGLYPDVMEGDDAKLRGFDEETRSLVIDFYENGEVISTCDFFVDKCILRKRG